MLPNPDHVLTPGLFARVQLESATPSQAILIDDKAVLTDQDRKYVYVVGPGNTAQRKDIVLSGMSDGLRIVKSGLTPDDRVIVGGQDKYQDGQEIDPVLTSEPASETQQESGGMIDMRGDEDAANANGSDAVDERHAGQTATQKSGATEPGVNQNDSREPGAKRVGGGTH